MKVLECENLCLGYEGMTVVENASFSVEEGDYICILGRNGAGKSTFVKGLLGLIPATSGKVTYEKGMKSKIGYVPQFMVLQKDFPATVHEVVMSGFTGSLGRKLFFSKAQNEKVKEILEKLNLSEYDKASFSSLSVGQKQRILLARAVCADSKVLFLDEPASGLDPAASAEFYNIISDLNSNEGVTVIMISHDINGALRNGKKILHIDKEIEFFGSTKEYLKTDSYRRLTGGDLP